MDKIVTLQKILWIVAFLSAIFGAIEFMGNMSAAESAPQQAAGAAMALCYAVIPYCLARALQELSNLRETNETLD